MLAVYDDVAVIAHALAFESALAQAQAAQGVIDIEAAAAIAEACQSLVVDPFELAEEAALAGTLAIPLVRRLRAALPPELASLVHKGATSQDLADAVMVRQARAAMALVQADVERIERALSPLAERHAATPAIGRTLLQDALPIGFGLRIAHWRAGIVDAADRLSQDVAIHAKVQLGGAAGTRAGLDGKGAKIAEAMAQALGLSAGEPWHSRRNAVAAIGASVGILIGTVGKMARDIALLAQNGVAEAREPAIAGRGGSSAMAHKRNPTGCQVALSAAVRAPGLVAGLLAGLPQEEERGLGGWQAEGPALADLFLLAAGALDSMAQVSEGLEIDEAAIARNLEAANLGTDIGESQAITAALLAPARKP
jgi:3-carboxy-cis,cis-muconate cycloisomerase